MTPPTGLTFVIHALIVIVRKILALFGFDNVSAANTVSEGQNLRGKKHVRKQAFFSVIVILLVGVYMGWIIVMFVGRAIDDKYANWKVADKTAHSISAAIQAIKLPAPPAPIEAAKATKVSEDLYIPYRFFSDRASPYISLYTQQFHLSSKH
ncbi:MAG TPA: hypothetical protein PK950_00620 [Candidatus Paceibacterota bacterium]|nr:hypothetical protein [Candidatus Paceibacterota bacterium]